MALANGKIKSIFSLTVDDVDYVTDLVSFNLTSDEADEDSMTFAEFNAGTNRVWTLEITAVWDGGSDGSLHDYLWNNAGAFADFEIQPISGTISAQKPHYTGQVRIPFKPDIEVEAGTDSVFDYVFDVVGEPSKSIATSP